MYRPRVSRSNFSAVWLVITSRTNPSVLATASAKQLPRPTNTLQVSTILGISWYQIPFRGCDSNSQSAFRDTSGYRPGTRCLPGTPPLHICPPNQITRRYFKSINECAQYAHRGWRAFLRENRLPLSSLERSFIMSPTYFTGPVQACCRNV